MSTDELAERKKFESFTFGKSLPSNFHKNHHGHFRSHSRSTSISSSSFSLSSRSTNSFDGSSASIPAPSSKRNSHHKRRSSVSTRGESAEMMGVSLPDLPPSTSEDNINFGDKDSIRRRALLALEGKSDVPYSKVEIPELSTPKLMSDLSSKPSVSQIITPTYGQSLSILMANKRDSFKLLSSSSSSKDQLHTLVEEEEEDDDLQTKPQQSLLQAPEPPLAVSPVVAVVKAPPSRHRPANLTLRPLSLTPENLISVVNGLPTPSPTPIPRPGLKSLALSPSSSIMDDDSHNIPNITTKQKSLATSPSSPRPSLSVNIPNSENPPVSAPSADKSARRSSIRYKSSSTSSISSNGSANFVGLPTPEMTPTSFDRRSSMSDSIRNRHSSIGTTSSGEDEFFPAHASQGKSLSASEQHFLFKSHNALLARITVLERALSMRRRDSSFSNTGSSRPVSMASDFSSSEGGSEPSDEMLRLVADLKAERDELKRDVDGWRTRVGDMERQLGIFTKRVETERRDGWVARSMVGLLEVEKSTLEKKLGSAEKLIADMEDEKKALAEANEAAQKKISAGEEDLTRVKRELEEEKKARQEAMAPVSESDILSTPTPNSMQFRSRPLDFTLEHGFGFTSLNSEGSTTDVDDSFEESNDDVSLKAVAKEPEELLSEEENGLAGYEDEEDSDLSFRSSSSFDSEDDLPRSATHLKIHVPSSVTSSSGSNSGTPTVVSRSTSPALDISSRLMHVSRASLSKTWTFPKGSQVSTVNNNAEVDRFFGCLNDDDVESSGGSAPASPSSYSYEKHKGLFASGFKYGPEDDDGPFFLPDSVGVKVNEESKLAIVVEEEDEDDTQTQVDEDEDMFGEVGGITITFTPPEADDASFDIQRSSSPIKKSVASFNFLDEEGEEEGEAVPFNFGRPIVADIPKVVVSAPPPSGLITPPSSLTRPAPSSIPRATTAKPSFSSTEIATSTPPRLMPLASPSTYASNASVTPPAKRGGTMPSFIPQAVSSPSPIRPASISRTKGIPSSKLVRQPQRKPLMVTNNTAGNQGNSVCANVNTAMNASSVRRSSEVPPPSTARPPSEMKSMDPSAHHIADHIPNTTTCEYPVQDRNISPSSHSTSAVPAGSSNFSSFSSIMSSPLSARLSFQTLTNFIPVAWSPRSHNMESPASLSHVTSSSEHAPERGTPFYSGTHARRPMDVPRKRGYVSKEKQLEKLRNLLECDGVEKMRTSVNVHCKRCDEEVVFL